MFPRAAPPRAARLAALSLCGVFCFLVARGTALRFTMAESTFAIFGSKRASAAARSYAGYPYGMADLRSECLPWSEILRFASRATHDIRLTVWLLFNYSGRSRLVRKWEISRSVVCPVLFNPSFDLRSALITPPARTITTDGTIPDESTRCAHRTVTRIDGSSSQSIGTTSQEFRRTSARYTS